MIAQYVFGFAQGYPKLFLSIVVVMSMALLVKSADMLLYGVTRYFHRLGLSDYLTGLIVVAAVASFPELVSSITGASLGDHGIVFGTILGSNVGGLTLILGIMALVAKKLDIRSKLFNKVKMLVFFVTVLPLLLVIDGTLSRIDGGILILAYCAYVVYLWKKENKKGGLKKVKLQHLWQDGLTFLLAFIALLLSARWLIFGVTEISKRMGISSFIVSVVILGIGAQLPDLIVIVRSQMAGHQDVGMGDLLGSTITKQLMFLGLVAIMVPLTIPLSLIAISSVALVISMLLVLYYMRVGWVSWKAGIFFIAFYVMYIILEVFINAL